MEMRSSHTSLSLPTLLCEEDQSCFFLSNDREENLCQCCIFESDDECMEKLIDKEASLQSNVAHLSTPNGTPGKTERGWLRCARLDAVKWILDTRVFFGFHFQTVFLSLIYLDSFFSKRSVELWIFFVNENKGFVNLFDRRENYGFIRLLSVACVSLAAKMEEYRAPALSEYHIDECNFEGSVIQRMEVLVLETLEWKMNQFTPFNYFRYFIDKFCGESRPKGLISRAIELTLAIVKEVNLVKFPPSMIAAAAVLAACDCHTTKKILELKMSVISSWGSSQKAIQKAKLNTPNPWSPINLPLKRSNSSDCLENFSIISSAVGTKRRFTYTDKDDPRPLQKIHRP